ncbi:chaplin [Streptomyces sp. NPDC057689]|uniref:chaplin n=1 Tax=Streptomyces sp. NPDC057689 TaxID=3346213 RepID=UPI003691AAA1
MKYTKIAAVAAGTLMAVGAAAPAFADSGAEGAAVASPGVISGNTIQVPVHIPVNVCGNTIDVIGLLNPAFGNACAND